MDPTTAGAVVFLAFTTQGCVPCQQLHADFAEDARVQFVDAETNPDAVKQHRVTRYPTVIAMRDGAEVGRKVGYAGRGDMRRWMDKCDGTLVRALRILAREIQSDDGVANACIAEAANVIEKIADEVVRLRLAIARLAEQDATLSVCDGAVTVTMDATLTDAEREAVEQAAGVCELDATDERCLNIAAALRGLLERIK